MYWKLSKSFANLSIYEDVTLIALCKNKNPEINSVYIIYMYIILYTVCPKNFRMVNL